MTFDLARKLPCGFSCGFTSVLSPEFLDDLALLVDFSVYGDFLVVGHAVAVLIHVIPSVWSELPSHLRHAISKSLDEGGEMCG